MGKDRIAQALEHATDTRACTVGEGVLQELPALAAAHFPHAVRACVIADPRTWAVAGARVSALLSGAGLETKHHILEPGGRTFHADYRYVDEVRSVLQQAGTEGLLPVAVGSGVVNDLVKCAAGECSCPYMVCATAASVDGYSAFGAAIRSPQGAKMTYPCPAPRVIVADLDVMRTAPRQMTASGYADLLAKIPAGADWLLARALEAGAWHERAWHTVQDALPEALGNPEGVAAGQTAAFAKFVEGLMLGGFAMQDMQSSRPASGAEHMFSHILEMRNHTHRGDIVPHGIQVGVYTLFMSRLYERMLAYDYAQLDVAACAAAWPSWPEQEALARRLFADTLFPEMGVSATRAKYLDAPALAVQLGRAREQWPAIRQMLGAQLLPSEEVERRLRVVGAPAEPEEIGVTREASLENVMLAAHMRDRYNLLDFLYRTRQMDAFARAAFGLS